MKVGFFTKRVIRSFGGIATWTLSIFSTGIIFFPIKNKYRLYAFLGLVIIHILLYILVWIYINKKKQISLRIRGTEIIIKEGDIFDMPGKKVIAFNEFFDTKVDDVVIAKGSLNGVFITKYVENVSELDDHIKMQLLNIKPKYTDLKRSGKQHSYELGTIVSYKDYLLLAYSRFDEQNCAFLTPKDICVVYMNMWFEIDRIKACNSICLPILGSSNLVRGVNYSYQQLLELMLWSFRISEVKMERLSTISIVVHPSMVDRIDFMKLKDFED